LGVASSVAGVPSSAAGAAERRIAELTSAVWRLAERTGAPAADLVERIEADARTADRAHASAAAQAAGAQATALLLAALPLGGIALGYGIGVDPLQILFHTALGGGCAIGAALLQSVGLLWADRLATGPAR
jgi:tight adherence protein B